MAITKPSTVPQQLPFEKLSKGDLAAIVNQQSRDLAALVQQKHGLMTLLCTMVKHPDAIKVTEDGVVHLEVAALDELAENTRFNYTKDGDKYVLKVYESTYVLHAEPGHIGVSLN